MDLSKLPQEFPLVKLLQSCTKGHEIVITECSDGAIIFECLECPLWHMLTEDEEKYFRMVELPEEETQAIALQVDK